MMHNHRRIEAIIVFLLGNLSILLASLIQQYTTLMGWQVWSYFESDSLLLLTLSCFATAIFTVSLWNLVLVPRRWFRANSLLDITIEILGWVQLGGVRRQEMHLNFVLMLL